LLILHIYAVGADAEVGVVEGLAGLDVEFPLVPGAFEDFAFTGVGHAGEAVGEDEGAEAAAAEAVRGLAITYSQAAIRYASLIEGDLADGNDAKAKAFLRLLDLTIGTSENATIPHDLAEALEQIRRVAPTLVSNPAFRRLDTATRR